MLPNILQRCLDLDFWFLSSFFIFWPHYGLKKHVLKFVWPFRVFHLKEGCNKIYRPWLSQGKLGITVRITKSKYIHRHIELWVSTFHAQTDTSALKPLLICGWVDRWIRRRVNSRISRKLGKGQSISDIIFSPFKSKTGGGGGGGFQICQIQVNAAMFLARIGNPTTQAGKGDINAEALNNAIRNFTIKFRH